MTKQMSPSVLSSQVFVNTLAGLINGRRHFNTHCTGDHLNNWPLVNTKTSRVIHILRLISTRAGHCTGDHLNIFANWPLFDTKTGKVIHIKAF